MTPHHAMLVHQEHGDLPILHIFFFQAEDGIRDLTVTGVQTCALPISSYARPLDVTMRNGTNGRCSTYFFTRANNTVRSEEHTSELQSQSNLVCRLLLEKKKKQKETRAALSITLTRLGKSTLEQILTRS